MFDRSKCKVTVLNMSFTIGGAQKVMTLLANALADQGFDVTHLVMVDEGVYRDLVSPSVKIKSGKIPSARYRHSLSNLYDYFKNNDPDVFISSAYNEMGLLARMFSRSRCKFISTVHANVRSELNIGMRKKTKIALLWLARLLKNKADAIVSVSRSLSDDMQKLGMPKDKLHAIYNPIVWDGMSDLVSRPIDHPWFSEKTKPIVMAVGHLWEIKDHATLIRAFAIARRTVDARLVIAGGAARLAARAL